MQTFFSRGCRVPFISGEGATPTAAIAPGGSACLPLSAWKAATPSDRIGVGAINARQACENA
jgi:hypothetical protein